MINDMFGEVLTDRLKSELFERLVTDQYSYDDVISRFVKDNPAAKKAGRANLDRLAEFANFVDIRHGSDRVSYVIYLDTDDQGLAKHVFAAADALAALVGVLPDPPTIERGSFLRRTWGWVRSSVTREQVEDGLQFAARAAMLRDVVLPEAEHAARIADAVARLNETMQEIPNAAMLLGGLLYLKYPEPDGSPYIFSKVLSWEERMALHRDPEILRVPSKVIESLQLAVHVYRTASDPEGRRHSGISG